MKIYLVSQARNWPRGLSQCACCLMAVSLVAGCDGLSPQRTVERKIAGVLPRWIGPAAHYDVKVDGDSFAIGRGRVRRVQIDGKNVQLSSTVSMDRIKIDAHDVSFDRKARVIHEVRNVAFEGEVTQQNIDTYLAKARPNLTGASVLLRQDDVEASMPITVAGYTTTVSVSGTLHPSKESAKKLNFIANGGSIGRVPVPARLVNVAIDELNPVLDLTSSRFPVDVNSVIVHRGTTSVRGTATISERSF
jgi:hypothetical protein